jgi:hypothetical protein
MMSKIRMLRVASDIIPWIMVRVALISSHFTKFSNLSTSCQSFHPSDNVVVSIAYTKDALYVFTQRLA